MIVHRSSTGAPGRPSSRDAGAILPLVLVVAVILSMVVIALARFATTDLRYARVTEERAERQAAAIGAVSYGVERIRLRQTLCASAGEDFGAVTPGLLDRNETTTTLTCERIAGDVTDISGWAVVVTGEGISSRLLETDHAGDESVTGPIYLADVDGPNAVDLSGSGLDHVDGDLWHRRTTCPGGPVNLPANYDFVPPLARGPLCTDLSWNQIVSAPPVPALNALPVNDGSLFTELGACRIFPPGRYTDVPRLDGRDAYFQSGVYWFDDLAGAWTGLPGLFEVENQTAWFGHPGPLAGSESTRATMSPDCGAARDADPNLGGVGAVMYLSGRSRVDVDDFGAFELFPRSVAGRPVSVHALDAASGYPPSLVTPAVGNHIVETRPGTEQASAVIHGLVWAPRGWFRFGDRHPAALQQLLGGAVVARLTIDAATGITGFEISPATIPVESEILLTARSTSVASGFTTEVQAIVRYRAAADDPDDRVAIRSLRIVD